MAKFTYTVIKDKADKRDRIVAPSTVVIPPSYTLPEVASIPVKNQGQEGSCTANAGSVLREFLRRKYFQWETDKTDAQTIELSAQFLYWVERLIEGTTNEDNGVQSRTIFKALLQYGVCPESEDPYEDTGWGTSPPIKCFPDGLKFTIGAYHRIPNFLALKASIASGYPATMGINVYESFESDQVASSGMVPVPGPNEQLLGGHEIFAFGYSDTQVINTSQGTWTGGILCRNSWGEDWGIKGDFWMPYAFEPNVMDIWMGHLGKPW
jgi:C1A family cysteine protease